VPDGPLDRLRDLLSAWRTDARVGLVVLAVVAVVAGVVWYQVAVGAADEAPPRPSSATTEPSTAPNGSSPAAASPPAGSAAADGGVVVHVAGAVTHPGVVELEAGARVIDAVEAAGGALATADLDRLNLAAKLTDGQRVLVQKLGDPVAPGATTGDPTATPGETPGGLINLNTATSEQLEELPGIGPVLAEAILTEREGRGGFRNVLELRDVRGIGEKRFADLVDLVTI
jgi:competence protein ComEA